jgi:hypothetical protein
LNWLEILARNKHPGFFSLSVTKKKILKHWHQEVWVQAYGLLEVVDGQPDLSLGIEDAAEVAPRDRKVGPRLDGLQIASLESGNRQVVGKTRTGRREGGREKKN